MTRRFSLIWCLFFVAFLSACASTRPKEVYGPGFEQPPSKEPQIELPEAITPKPPEVKKGVRPKIALVLGGAGVASFATVGLLKRFHEEGVEIDFIVASGGPALFSLGYGFLSSVHDVEWFAMRLGERDLKKLGSFDTAKELDAADKAPSIVENTFKKKSLGETRIPIVISTVSTDLVEPETYERGDWHQPIFATLSIPGLYREFPKQGIEGTTKHVKGIDTSEAERRGALLIVSVDMFGDYLAFQKTAKKGAEDRDFRRDFLASLQKGLKEESRHAAITGRIVLNRAPTDLGARRDAIRAGYREGSRLAKEIRAHAPKNE